MKRILCLATIFALVVAFSPAAYCEEAPAAPPAPKIAKAVGDAVPAWSGTNLVDSAVVKSEDLKGKAYALVFVNSSCSACRGEMGDLVKRKFGKKLSLYLVSLDAKPERSWSSTRNSSSSPIRFWTIRARLFPHC